RQPVRVVGEARRGRCASRRRRPLRCVQPHGRRLSPQPDGDGRCPAGRQDRVPGARPEPGVQLDPLDDAPAELPGAAAASPQLPAGPTSAEHRRAFRTYVPATTRVRSVTIANGVATVDLTQPFVTGTSPESMLARLSELVRTLTGVEGTTSVQLLVNGATTAG